MKSVTWLAARLRQTSWAERRLLAEAVLLLAVARLSVLVLPFRWLSALLGGDREETALDTPAAAAAAVGQAVERVSRFTPWRSNCLAQALAGHVMLRRRHVPTTLYLGVAKDADVRLHAHAWLRSGTLIVTGRSGHERFAPVMTYAWRAPAAFPMGPEALAALKRAGDGGPAEARPGATVSATPASSDDEEARRVRTSLAALANVVHSIAEDAAAFGPYARERFRDNGGRGLDERLASALGELVAVQGSFKRWRAEFVSGQLDRLGLRHSPAGLKLNVGAGRFPLDGWVNIGVHPAQLEVGLGWGLPFPDGSADWISALHVLEHLYFPHAAEGLLREFRRVLSPRGVVRIAVPDVEKGLRAYAENDAEFFAGRKRIWRRDATATRLQAFLTYAGAGPRPGAFLSSHKFGYDFETLASLLRLAGFGHVERSSYMQSRHDTLRVDNVSQVAGAGYGGDHYSLFVEAWG